MSPPWDDDAVRLAFLEDRVRVLEVARRDHELRFRAIGAGPRGRK
jgi:hypothetical protein